MRESEGERESEREKERETHTHTDFLCILRAAFMHIDDMCINIGDMCMHIMCIAYITYDVCRTTYADEVQGGEDS